jgi:hypothetical protein
LSEKVFTAGCHVGQKLSAASVIERARGIPEVSEILASSADWASFSVLARKCRDHDLKRPCGSDPLASNGNYIALKQGVIAAQAAKAALSGRKATASLRDRGKARARANFDALGWRLSETEFDAIDRTSAKSGT